MRSRPAIITIEESSIGSEASCTVTLAYGDAEFYGRSIGNGSARPRIVGEATLRAVEAVTDGDLNLTLDAVAITEVGDAVIALAQVTMEGASDPLVGSALVQENDPSKATVKAVLDALNRRISTHLS